MVEVRHTAGWEPAGSLPPVHRRLVEQLLATGVVAARFEFDDGGILEVRRSEPGGSVGPEAGASLR